MTGGQDSAELFTPVRRGSVLRDRNFVRLWIGETISLLGSSISRFAFAIVAVVTLHATPGQMGLIRALGEIPVIAFGLVVGVWVDRLSRRRLLVTLDLVAATAVTSIPIAHALGVLSIGQLYVLAIVFGVMGAFWDPAWGSFLPTVVSRDQLVDANAKLTIAWSGTDLVGPSLAGVLVKALSAPVAMLVDAASFLVSAVFVRGVRSRERPVEDDEDGSTALLERIRAGVRVAFRDRQQRAVTAPIVILSFVDALSLAVYVIFVLRVVRLSSASLGLILSVAAAGFLAGAAVAPRVERRLGAGRAALLGLGLVGASPFTMILADASHPLWVNLTFLGLPGLIGGFGGVIQFVMLSSIRQAITPDRLLGRVVASIAVLTSALAIAGALVGGWIGDTVGPRGAIVVAAVSYSVPFLWSLFTPLRHTTTKEPDDAAGATTEPPPSDPPS